MGEFAHLPAARIDNAERQMNFAEIISGLKTELSTLQGAHDTLKGAHKTLNEQFTGITGEKTALAEKVTAHEATIAGHVAKITELEGKLAEAEKKAGLTQTQISTAVVNQIAAAGVVPVKRDTEAANTPEGDAKPAGTPKQRLAAIFNAKLGV